METDRFSTATKFKTNTRGLDVIQSVYAFAMALGLTAVFVGSKTFLNDIIFGAAPVRDGRAILTGLLFANVVLLGLRFFWVPRNLGALVFKAAECMVRDESRAHKHINISNLSIAFHLVMIFAHGTIFFLICAEFEYVVFLASSNLPLDGSLFTGYVIMHVCLLLLNAAWIGLIKIQEARMERRINPNYDDDPSSAGSVWWQNNLICSLIGIAPFAILGSCNSELARCATHASGLTSSIIDLAPASAGQISIVFQGLAGWLAQAGLVSPAPSLMWVLVVLLINSLYDLLTTGRSYLFFEDVEWESQPHEAQASPSPARPTGESAI